LYFVGRIIKEVKVKGNKINLCSFLYQVIFKYTVFRINKNYI